MTDNFFSKSCCDRCGGTLENGRIMSMFNEDCICMVFLHGYGQSRMGWMTTPDGREGWSTSFLRKGHSVFFVDQPSSITRTAVTVLL